MSGVVTGQTPLKNGKITPIPLKISKKLSTLDKKNLNKVMKNMNSSETKMMVASGCVLVTTFVSFT